MHILMYHRGTSAQPHENAVILDRAAHKRHLQKKTLLWDVLLFVTVGVLGVLLHMAGSFFAGQPLLRCIAPVNESIWEHLKLLFWPAFLIAVLRRLFTGKLQHGILTTFAQGMLLAMGLLVVGFYTYSGIWGQHSLRADIALFFLCDLVLTLFVRFRAEGQKKSSLPGLFVWLLLAGCFIYFSYYPPDLGIFQDLSRSQQ